MDDWASGEGPRENSGGLSRTSSSVLSTKPSQTSTSPSLELERLLYDRQDEGRSATSSRSLSGTPIEPASSDAEMSSQSESEILSSSERLVSWTSVGVRGGGGL